MANNTLEENLKFVFRKVFRRNFKSNTITVREVEEWDSLSHIKLVMELEMTYGLDIDPDEISSLYSDFSTVLVFLKEKGVEA